MLSSTLPDLQHLMAGMGAMPAQGVIRAASRRERILIVWMIDHFWLLGFEMQNEEQEKRRMKRSCKV